MPPRPVRPLTFPYLLVAFVALRLMALLLYLPGGLLAPLELPYPDLTFIPVSAPLVRQLAGGLLLLPFDVLTLWLIIVLMQQSGQPREGHYRAFLWAISPLPLYAWLVGPGPFYLAAILAGFGLLRVARRNWLIVALPLTLATVMGGAQLQYTALIFPFVLLLVPDPGWAGVLFAVGALAGGPLAETLGVTGLSARALSGVYLIGLAPALSEWLLMTFPLLGWQRWRQLILVGSTLLTPILLFVTLFALAPADLRPQRLAASSLAPLITELQRAPTGYLLTDDPNLWEEATMLGSGNVRSYVVSRRNVATLRTTLEQTQTPVWIVQSTRAETISLLDPVVADFYQGDITPSSDGVIVRRFVSNGPATEMEVFTPSATFTDGVTLETVRVGQGNAGSLLPVELEWTGPLGTAKIFLHVVTADGTRVAQRDALPTDNRNRHAITLPTTLAPGDYTLLIGRYNGDTGERVLLSDGADRVEIPLRIQNE